MNSTIIMTVYLHRDNQKIDIEVPKDITANELVVALNTAFDLGIDTSDIKQCYLKTENPIALIKGDKPIKDYELRDGTIINITI